MKAKRTSRSTAPRGPNRRDAHALARAAYHEHLRGNIDAALAGYKAALRADPRSSSTWCALGSAELSRGAFGEAARCFRECLTLRPGFGRAKLDLGHALFGLGEVDTAIARVREAKKSRDARVRDDALGYLAVIVPGGERETNRSIFATRRAWGRRLEREVTPVRRLAAQRAAKKLRIGYVSAYFGFANWMKPVFGVVNHHDRDACEIHLFADGAGPSRAAGYRENSLDHVHDTTALSNDALARHIARSKIDVLVDLNAYSFSRRLGVFVRRPAPMQIGWFNSYATTGLAAFDVVVGDDSVILDGEERFYVERVVQVPGSYLAFSVPYHTPPIANPPCLSSNQFTFGSFCSQYKLTDGVIDAWSAILRRVPNTRLFSKNRALGEPSNRRELERRLARRGVDPSRVTMEGPETHAAFLRAYSRVDVALDAFPYSGGTTTMEALWQGVPVLTFSGDRWASRTSSSLLRAAGLGDWCAPSVGGYVARAVELARSPATGKMLENLRKTLRARLRASAACDSERLARALERIYREASDRAL